jgi:hypothetical protein
LAVLWAVDVVGVALDQPTGTTAAADAVRTDDAPFVRRPNVYHFILDQYPRADEAQAVLGLDLAPFTHAMQERGFWVGDHSYSAYPTTVTSIPALLSAQYRVTTNDDLNASEADLTRPILGTADVIQEFKAQGYQYLYAGAGHDYWGTCRGDLIDRCLGSTPHGLIHTEAQQALIWRTPLSTLINGGLHYARPENVIDDLVAHEDDVQAPFYLFAHMLSPHGPFEYEQEDCTVRSRSVDFQTEAIYAHEMQCLDDEMLRVVDTIQERDPDAVIIIQSDHGTMFDIDFTAALDRWSEDQLRQRFAVLDLRTVPEGCDPPPSGPTLTINTYPWLLACLRGEAPEYLPDRAFLTRHNGVVQEIPEPFAAFGEDESSS